MRAYKFIVLLLVLLTLVSGALAEHNAEAANVSTISIVLKAPTGWTADASAAVRVVIDTDAAIGSYTVHCRLNQGAWEEITAYLSDGQYDYPVTENGICQVRATDAQGCESEAEIALQCFDREAPIVTASINGQTLRVAADDPHSGVAGIQVNSLLYTEVDDSALAIDLTGELCHFASLAVRAFDFCGNFSEPVLLENPCYTQEATPTPTPTTVASTPVTTAHTISVATAKPCAHDTQNSVWSEFTTGVYVQNTTPVLSASPSSPTPTPAPKTEYIALGPGMPYTPNGNGHTRDVLYSAATNKQFLTIESKQGHTFYLIIDYDKPVDEDAEMYQTYFLNLVDERDLLSLLDETELSALASPTPEIVYITPSPTVLPVLTAAPLPVPDSDSSKPSFSLLAAIAALLVFGFGAIVLMLQRKQSAKHKQMPDYGIDDEDDEDDESSGAE